MKKVVAISLQNVKKVIIYDKQESPSYVYKPFKKRFFLDDRKEGFYHHNDNCFVYTPIPIEEIENKTWRGHNYLVVDKKVYLSPYVKIRYYNGDEELKNFKTYEEAQNWGNLVISQIKIKVELFNESEN